MDTGAYKTVMDRSMAIALGLKIRPSVDGDCGRFGVPGSGVVHEYAGVIEDPFVLRLGEKVVFTIHGMKVLEHPHPLVLIGADVLRGGRGPTGWNYDGMALTTHAPGKVSGVLKFSKGDE